MKFRFLSVACMIPKALAPGCSSHTMSYHIPFDSLFSHETSNWKKWKLKSLSHVQLFAIPWTVAYQALPSMGFSRQEYWSGLTFPSPGDLPDPRIKPRSPTFQADTLTSEPPGKLEHQLCLPLTHLAFTFTIPSVTVVPLPGYSFTMIGSCVTLRCHMECHVASEVFFGHYVETTLYLFLLLLFCIVLFIFFGALFNVLIII